MFKPGDRVLVSFVSEKKPYKALILQQVKSNVEKDKIWRIAVIDKSNRKKAKMTIEVYEKDIKLDVVANMKNGAWRNAGKTQKYD